MILLEAAGSAGDFARVINIGSIDGMHVSLVETYSYAASKAGVLHMTRMMAKFLAPGHIAALFFHVLLRRSISTTRGEFWFPRSRLALLRQ
jgi:NAD(P)-dependent dehydrogenase (short-subunit alcohol dehydrogenase family)